MKFVYFEKMAWKDSIADLILHQKTAQTVRWPKEPITLSIEHFEGPTEV